MKVSDIMQRSLITISEDASLKEVARIIYRVGVAGVPVVKGKKLVGIVTERDVLSRVYPKMEEVVEDYVHASNFELMEENFSSILNLPVSKVMSRQPVYREENASIMEAQSSMFINGISRLPIVDKSNNLIGIVSQGDIFRALMSREISQLEAQSYETFVGNYYDEMVDWDQRFKYELPVLKNTLEEGGIRKVLDLGVWTGRHTTGFARESNFFIVGVDHNPNMIQQSELKRKRSSKEVQKRLSFKLIDYKNLRRDVGEFDAAISMGNAFPFIPISTEDLIMQLGKVLSEKKGMILLQILNFDKYEKKRDRLLSFVIKPCVEKKNKEHLTFDFFDKKDTKTLLHNTVLFDREGHSNWVYKGTTTIPINYPNKEMLNALLKKADFSNVVFSGGMGEYQGAYGEFSFTDKFDPLESNWMNVIAKR